MAAKMTEAEQNFAEIIWENGSISTSELVKICEQKFLWKKSTTYTILKRLENKGIFINEKGIVKAILNKHDWETEKSEEFINENFQGSLPKFIAAFTRGNKLNKNEIDELKRLIEEQEE